MKVCKFGRFIFGATVAKDGVFDITQKSGTKYSFPLALGWVTQPPVDDGFEPLTAFTCFFGPLSIAIGYVKP